MTETLSSRLRALAYNRADLADAMINNLDEIVLALDENERMREALTAIRNLCANWSDSPDFNPTVTEVHELARAALAQIKDTRP